MSDLIKREDVAEALYQAIRTTLTGTFTDSMSLAIAMANNLPSAVPERKWIPVTEALPKPWQEVLTTYEYKGKRFVQTAEYAGQNDENGHPLFCAYSDEFATDHYDFVYLAWMPLPEAWRGE